MPYYRNSRPVPVLPEPSTIPFPGNLIRVCESCDLRKGCTAPVPGEGPTPAKVMLVGEAPGEEEDLYGRPFVGRAGQQLDSLLQSNSISRSSIYISNTVHCRPPQNVTPKPVHINACRKWLELELKMVSPSVVVAMGATAIQWFLGWDAGTVEHLHGHPVRVDGRIILPCYHPAAALRNTSFLRYLNDDFKILRGLMNGRDISEYVVRDEYPNPDYRVADTDAKLVKMGEEIRDSGIYGVDTELWRQNTKLWSAQLSAHPGTGWFVPIPEDHRGRVNLRVHDALAVVHNYLFDINWVDVSDNRFRDTMVMAYLLSLPQGLKELAYRLCGIRMVNYNEVVRPGQHGLCLEYLDKVLQREWPDPPIVVEDKWNKKAGRIVARNKKPWHIVRKIKNRLKNYGVDTLKSKIDIATCSQDADLFSWWKDILQPERDVVESVLGVMPESSLADISFEDAVVYATRDADATLRVFLKLKELISESNLDFVLNMDTAILPMVRNMMDNGMAVDLTHFKVLSAELSGRMAEEADKCAKLIGHSFNPNSPVQVGKVIYDELNFPVTKTTDSGNPSTDDQELKKVNHPVVKEIIKYRGLLKLKSTYADNIIASSHPDEDGVPRFHTVLKTTRTETGRLSSSKDDDGEGGNLQNIPTRSKDGKRIRLGFVAPAGKVLAEGDYGQIEVVSVAHLARCKGLIELFERGEDPHTVTAAKIFGVPYEEAKQDKYRYPTKRANFGVIYMIGPKGLSDQIQEYIADLIMADEPVDVDPWDVDTCQKFIDDWYKLYPEVRDYQFEQIAHARRYGFVTDMFNRRRYIPEVSCPIRDIREAGERQAANMGVQATAQGIIKLSMGKLWRETPSTQWGSYVRWLMQIHDSLISEIDEDDDIVKGFLAWVEGVMTSIVKLSVPLKVDFKVGKKWGELSKINLK